MGSVSRGTRAFIGEETSRGDRGSASKAECPVANLRNRERVLCRWAKPLSGSHGESVYDPWVFFRGYGTLVWADVRFLLCCRVARCLAGYPLLLIVASCGAVSPG